MLPDVPEPPSEGASSHVAGRRSSRRWLTVAVLVTVACVLALGIQFANLLELPTLASDRPGQATDARQGALVVAVARTPGGPGEWSNWARIIRVLSEELEVPVTVRYLSKEDEAARVIAQDKVDIAFVCAHHYVDLTEDGVSEGLVTPVIGGSTMSSSQLVVRSADLAGGIEDLTGSIVAVSDKSSLGGFAYLSYLVKQHGGQPEGYFSELRLGETQEQNLHDVLAGKARATVINTAQVPSLDLSTIRVIEQSEPFGCPPVVVRSDMDPELRDRILAILIAMDMDTVLPEGSAIDGFEKLDPREYAFARELRGACGHHAEE